MIPYIHLGSITVASFGVCLSCGFLCAIFFTSKECRRLNLPIQGSQVVLLMGTWGLLFAHLILVLERHNYNTSRIGQGFSSIGAVVGGGFSLFILAFHFRVSPLRLGDAVSSSSALGYAWIRFGCFLAGDGCHGKVTDGLFGMAFPHGVVPTLERVHPTHLYESVLALAGFAVICYCSRVPRKPGSILSFFLIIFGSTRFFVEFTRVASGRTVMAQSMSLAAVAIGALIGISAFYSRAEMRKDDVCGATRY